MKFKKLCPTIAFAFISLNTYSGSISGKVDMLEVWANGNVAFTLDTPVPICNSQFVLNYSSNGTKNIYSALLAAKISGKSVAVYYSDECGTAENYGSTPYVIPLYVYPGSS